MLQRIFMGWLIAALVLSIAGAGRVWAGADPGDRFEYADHLEDQWTGRGWQGGVNWEEGVIEVSAQGVSHPARTGSSARAEIMALKAARYMGYQKLLEVIKGVRLDSERTVGDWSVSHPRITARVRGVVKGAEVIEEGTGLGSDGSITGRVRLRLALGDPMREMAPARVKPLPLQPRQSPANNPVFHPGDDSYQEQARRGEFYTGLIVNASGLGARPALFPSIVDAKSGKEVFGPHTISRKYAQERGVVGYAASLAKARTYSRVGSNPMVVRAIRAEGKNKAQLVISYDQAVRVFGADIKSGFIQKCGVVIVLN